MHLVSIAAGGVIGSLLRYGMSQGVHGIFGRGFPYGTLAVNVTGSLLIGILYIVLTSRLELSVNWRALLIVGLLGAFTTFSTFSLETVELLEEGEMIKALGNVGLNVACCLGATWIGLIIGRAI